ncbi:2'-5' RNA ligase family protein [Streptomyces flavidovirens]|uniref:2'-5' RNA ligase family protein n=1 Tax=Streptomyces flavidovirens TaxID=67298 RepID=A0ABW6RB00_9ACTN
MKQFVPNFAGRPWPDGASVLHVYALPDLRVDRDLGVLVEECRTAMKPFPILPLSDDLLHITVEMVSDVTSDHITATERAELVTGLRKSLAGVPSFQVLAGSPVANKAGAYLDCWPDEDLHALHSAVRTALRTARGTDAVQYGNGRPHCSLGYSYADAESDLLQSAFRKISPSHASYTVRSVDLVDVTFTRTTPSTARSDTAWEFSFTSVATIPLADAA